MNKIISSVEAAKMIKNNANVVITGLISILCPEMTMKAIEQRFLDTGEPRGLNVITPIRLGWKSDEVCGMEHFAHEGMLKRHITGSFHPSEGQKIMKMVYDGVIEAYSWPMGVTFQWIREIAGKRPGLATEVGIGTYFDTRNGGGKLNNATKEDLIKLIEIEGQEVLWIPSIPIDVAIIMGTTADEDGNISMENEAVTLGNLYMAMAAHNSGGKVIAQVKRITKKGTIHPRQVVVPGVLVDAVVVDEKQVQSRKEYDPSLTGEVRIPMERLYKSIPLNDRKLILRRAAMEIKKGQIVNLGIGIGVGLPFILMEEEVFEDVKFSIEHGVIGGVPGGPEIFGAHYNPDSIIDSTSLFDFYQGGGLDVTLLGFAQIDKTGNVNVSNFSGRLRGPGGLIDITHMTKKIIFGGTLTSGGLQVNVNKGSINIIQEGGHKKFLNEVEQITFNGQKALERGQEVFYITERCVFKLYSDGLKLIEVAPGVDIDKDIRPYIDFEFTVSDSLNIMCKDIYNEKPMGLKEIWKE